MLPSEKDCRRIVTRALEVAKAEDASVLLSFGRSSNTRFANNEVTTSGAVDSVTVVLTATQAGRTGRVTLNETSDAALERGIRRAEEMAALVPADPEYVGPMAVQSYLAIQAFDAATEKSAAAERVPGVRAVIEPAAREKMNSSGYYSNGASVNCVANKAGNFGYHRSTSASFSATVRTADGTGSGWAEDASFKSSEVDGPGIAARALQKARDSANAKPLDPGDYTVILEPAAVASLFGNSISFALSARAAEEGRSFFSKKGGGTLLGEKLFHESVTLGTDPTDKRRPGSPWVSGAGFGGGGGFSDAGLAQAPTTWVRKGVLETLWYDRYWAKKSDRAPTSFPTNLVLEGGHETVETLIAGTDRGLLVTNFWYIRSVNPQTLQLTGLTRDGLWLIENGKIVHPVANFRFNESPAVVLANVLGMSAAVRAGSMVVPAIKAAKFTFSSRSDAV